MGYRGKTRKHEQARELRAAGWTIKEIAAELHVSPGSVSTWVRDVEVDAERWQAHCATRRNHGWAKRRASFERTRAAQAVSVRCEAEALLRAISDRDRFIAGIALYAGEGAKTRGSVKFTNSDPRMITAFLTWLRGFFEVDEARLRVRLYLHDGLDLAAANEFWSTTTGIPVTQFNLPYRAVADPSIRRTKHPMGCPTVIYSCTHTHEVVMALVDALLSSNVPSGVAQLAERAAVNR